MTTVDRFRYRFNILETIFSVVIVSPPTGHLKTGINCSTRAGEETSKTIVQSKTSLKNQNCTDLIVSFCQHSDHVFSCQNNSCWVQFGMEEPEWLVKEQKKIAWLANKAAKLSFIYLTSMSRNDNEGIPLLWVHDLTSPWIGKPDQYPFSVNTIFRGWRFLSCDVHNFHLFW